MAARSALRVRAYGFAFLTFLLAALLRFAIDPWLGGSFPFLLFFPAILIAARYGGFGPGLLVTVLSSVALRFGYRIPLGVFATGGPADLLQVVRFAAVGAVISGLIHMVRAARSDQWRLAAIVESSDDAIVSKNLEGVITSWNRGAERLFGFSAAEAVGRSITFIIPDERRAEEDEVLHRVRSGQRVEPFETLRRRKDGSDVEVSIRVSPISDGAGTIVGASKIARDITDRKRIEREQAELVERQRIANDEAVAARDRLAFLSEVSAALSTSLDYEETLDRAVHVALPRLGDYCNVLVAADDGRAPARRVGPREPIEGARASRSRARGSWMSPTRRASRRSPAASWKAGRRWSCRTNGCSKRCRSCRRRCRPSSSISAMRFARTPTSVRRFAFAAGSSASCHSARPKTTRNASTRMPTWAWWRSSPAACRSRWRTRGCSARPRSSTGLKDEFLATLSHELRTPLSAVLGWSRMLASGQLDRGKVKQAAEAIERNAQAQAKIVDDILDVARGMGGNLRLDLKPFDLVTVAHRAVEAVAPAALGKHIQIDLHAPAAVVIVGDSNRLQQVAWNLMSNALKFTPAGGKVTVDVAASDGHAELQVADTGIGIPSVVPAVCLRQVPSGRCLSHASAGRAGAWSRDRAPPGRAARRLDRSSQRG